MYTAQLPDQGPFVIRYPRGRGVLLDWKCPLEEIPVGQGRRLKEGKDLAVITLGPIGNVAARAIERAEKDKGCLLYTSIKAFSAGRYFISYTYDAFNATAVYQLCHLSVKCRRVLTGLQYLVKYSRIYFACFSKKTPFFL